MRIVWMDNMKVLALFAVALAHLTPDSLLRHYLYCVPIPVFFFASGYFFERGKYDFRQFFIKRVRTLVVPYLFFASISFLFWFFVVRNLSVGGRALAIDPVKSLVGIFYGVGSGEWRIPENVALWFLPSLFAVEMGFYFVRSVYILPVFAVLGYAASFLPFRLPWGVDVALTGMVFYGFGHFFKDRWMSAKAAPFLLAAHFTFCFLNTRVDMNYLEYGNPLYFYACTLSGVMFYACGCRLIKRNRPMEYIGRNTMVTLGMLGITGFIVEGMRRVVFGAGVQTGAGFALAASLLQFALSVPAIYGINTWMPFILGKPWPGYPGKGKRWGRSPAEERVGVTTP